MAVTLDRRALTIPQTELRLRPQSLHLNRPHPTWAEGAGNPVTSYTVTTGAVDTKGSWTEVFAAAEADIYELEIALAAIGGTVASGANSSTIIDVGTGAAGSEMIVAADLQVGHTIQSATWFIPIFIPAGSRVAVRGQSAQASKSVPLLVRPRTPRTPGHVPARYCLTYGVVTASSRGTVVTMPASANTKGAWTELVAATTERLSGLIVCVGSGSNNMSSQTILLDVGVGASGSETVVVPDVFSQYSVAEEIWQFGLPRIYAVDIPAGSRLAARMQKSVTTINHNCHVVGIPWRP